MDASKKIKLTFKQLMANYGTAINGLPKMFTAYVNVKLPEWSQNRELYQVNKQLHEKSIEVTSLLAKLGQQYKSYTNSKGKIMDDEKAKEYKAEYNDLLDQEFILEVFVFDASLFNTDLPNAYLFELIDLDFLQIDKSDNITVKANDI